MKPKKPGNHQNICEFDFCQLNLIAINYLRMLKACIAYRYILKLYEYGMLAY